jgi:hypothetical protein
MSKPGGRDREFKKHDKLKFVGTSSNLHHVCSEIRENASDDAYCLCPSDCFLWNAGGEAARTKRVAAGEFVSDR